jgi:selenocysteine-specific elongation factor
VALTKVDLVDDETLAMAEADVRDVLASMNLQPIEVVPTSVQTGRGIEALRGAVEQLARSLPDPAHTARAFLPIDRVFNVKGAGVVVTGTLTRGRLTAGQELRVHGARGPKAGTCRSLQVHGRPAEFVDAPARVAVNIGRLGKDDIERGEVLSGEAELPVTRRLDVALRLLPGAAEELTDGSPAIVHLGTARAAARVVLLGNDLATLTLEEPLVALGGMGFVLRGFATDRERGAVLGGGRILDALAPPLPPRKDRDGRAHRAAALELCKAERFREAAVELMASSRRPLDGATLENRLGVEPGIIATWFGDAPADGVVGIDGGRSWTTEGVLGRLATAALGQVVAHHATHPHERGASLETVRTTLAETAGREAAEAALHRVVADGRLLLVDQGLLCTPDFAAHEHKASDDAALSLLAMLERARLEGLEEAAFVASGMPAAAARTALGRLAATGRARKLGGLWFAEGALDELRRALRAHFLRGASLSVAEFKELAGVSRKQAIPLLEQLDREGTTLRQGDVRLAGPLVRE